jgi:formylglycine-generating enzyme required for sulfatase activity
MTSLWFLAYLAVDFDGQVKPLLAKHCNECHDRAFYLRHKDSLLKSMQYPAGDERAMPPEGPRVPKSEQDLIAAWIAEGMKWPVEAKAMNDDLELTKAIRAQIVKQGDTPLRPYVEKVPGSNVSFEMLPVRGGKFKMGSMEKPDEAPIHERSVEAFFMSKTEVTWDLYRLFMFAMLSGEKPGEDLVVDAVSRPTKPYTEMSFGMGIDGFPAISMTHHAANKFAQWLSAKTGHFYRLPTEVEWEYACVLGQTKPEDAVFSAQKYAKVASKKPNALGLHDMLGNVMEWTADQYQAEAYTRQEPWVKSKRPYPHTARGGSWQDDARKMRCPARTPSDPSWKQQDPNLPKSIWYHTDALGLGIRLVRPAKLPTAEEMHAFWNNGVAEDN